MIGIYKYTNKINNKSYIGLTNDINRRCKEHKYMASKKDTSHFHQAINKYGIENFDFEILETFKIENRELMGSREQF